MRTLGGALVSNTGERLRDLVETRSAQYGVTRRKLWAWVFKAILKGDLIANNAPPLNEKFKHGGTTLKWSGVITIQLKAIERPSADPSDWPWTESLIFSPVTFDKWLKETLQHHKFPTHPNSIPGAKRTKRDAIKEFIDKEYPDGKPAGVTNKEIAIRVGNRIGKPISGRTVGRAFGRK
jgi:hypothetical protein